MPVAQDRDTVIQQIEQIERVGITKITIQQLIDIRYHSLQQAEKPSTPSTPILNYDQPDTPLDFNLKNLSLDELCNEALEAKLDYYCWLITSPISLTESDESISMNARECAFSILRNIDNRYFSQLVGEKFSSEKNAYKYLQIAVNHNDPIAKLFVVKTSVLNSFGIDVYNCPEGPSFHERVHGFIDKGAGQFLKPDTKRFFEIFHNLLKNNKTNTPLIPKEQCKNALLSLYQFNPYPMLKIFDQIHLLKPFICDDVKLIMPTEYVIERERVALTEYKNCNTAPPYKPANENYKHFAICRRDPPKISDFKKAKTEPMPNNKDTDESHEQSHDNNYYSYN